ncbi:MAG: 50S ribosomal protein L3 N(5)-glutamine methyltransferase [Gammaproteobacteria bacterium]|jgi:ribosomal protein L3 glutamine methyltransferase
MTSPTPLTVRDFVLDAEQRFIDAGLVFGHGTDNARDEAVFLVFDTLGLAFDCAPEMLDTPLDPTAAARVASIIAQRIESRRPAAYITGRMWFAGHEFIVDDRVLIPRSPLAELIVPEFAPWLDAADLQHIVEIGTGSGCIAVACALALPHAHVTATDISPAALAVARDNAAAHALGKDRVRFELADLFPSTPAECDLIITNPPYVPRATVDALPPEYAHEPRLALDAGADGLDCVRRICAGARARLADGGALIVDVGEMADVIDTALPWVNFTWVELEHGGEGIGIAYKSDIGTPPS